MSDFAGPGPGDARYDVAVLVEHSLSAASARRLMSFYDMKREPVRFHVIRPIGKADTADGGARVQADSQLRQVFETFEALHAEVDGGVTDDPPAQALETMVSATGSQEAVVVTSRHPIASFLHRDWASQARDRLEVPITHLTVPDR